MLRVAIKKFSYQNNPELLILQDIAFSLKQGEHLVVLGESGCGKSTLLHIIYGLLHLENGQLFLREKQLLGPNHNLVAGESAMKLVAQEFNVMPYISVAENIATHLDRNNKVVDVHVAMGPITRATFQMVYLLTVDGAVHSTGITVHGAVTPEGRPTRLPEWLRSFSNGGSGT